MFREFLGFLVAAGLFIHQVTTVTLLIFMEFLLDQGLSPSNLVIHVVAIRSQFILHGLDTSPIRDERIHLFQKSLKYTRPFCPKLTQIITIDMLSQILSVSETLQYPIVFKALYSFWFFSFLRLSNILPHTMASFEVTRQLCRGDLIFSAETITVLIKWWKTLQNRSHTTTICIPALGRSPLCSFKAMSFMLHAIPGIANAPSFESLGLVGWPL